MGNSRSAEEIRHVEIYRHCVPPIVVTGLTSIAANEYASRIHKAVEGTVFVNCVCDQFVTFI